jgi:hypothetical protein
MVALLKLIEGTDPTSPTIPNYCQELYKLQCQLIDHLMTMPGGLDPDRIFGFCTGSQDFPFEYSFNSVGFTNQDIED